MAPYANRREQSQITPQINFMDKQTRNIYDPQLFQTYEKLFRVFHKFYSIKNHTSPAIAFEDYVKIIRFLSCQYENKGGLYTINLIKFIRVVVYKHTSGDVIPIRPFFKTFKSGLPKVFGPAINAAIISKDPDVIKMVLTILNVSYQIPGCKDPSLDSVTDVDTSKQEVISDFDDWCKDNYKKIFKVRPTTFWNHPHVSTKAGPLGPATWTCVNELSLIPEDLQADLKKLGGPKFTAWFENCHSCSDYLIKSQNHIYDGIIPTKISRDTLRRITYVNSPEGKARVIAIFDYWSQTVLKEIHNWALAQLGSLEMDMTFNQAGFIDYLPKTGPYFSFDLKSATDRFPAKLQRNFLKHILGEERSTAWYNILTKYEFSCDWTKGTVRYTTGQPMGAYSSWGIFALCHHLIVRYAAKKAGNSDFKAYVILGDDIVIANAEVAKEYVTVINDLGVQIDQAKSLESIDSYEFAKRFVHRGKELTAFPLSAYIENSESISALWSTTLVSRERGYSLDSPSIPGFLVKVQSACGTRKRASYKMAKDLEALYAIKLWNDDCTNAWALQHMHETMNRPYLCRSNLNKIRQNLMYDLGFYIMKYKALLLETQYQKYQQLTFKLTGAAFDKGGIESMGSQAYAPIDMMRIPLVWIAKVNLDSQHREVNNLKGLLAEEAWDALLHLRVSPIGDLNRVVSRQTNLKQAGYSNKLIKFIRTEQSKTNDMIETNLKAT